MMSRLRLKHAQNGRVHKKHVLKHVKRARGEDWVRVYFACTEEIDGLDQSRREGSLA